MQAVFDFVANMPFWYWWVFAVILLVIELTTGSTYFLWPAIAALIVGVFAFFPFSFWQSELVLFAVATTALSIFAPPYVKPWIHKTQADHHTLNERGAQKIGQRGVVDQTFVNGAGKVRLGDTLWLAETDDGANAEAGEQVIVTRVDGVKLFVTAG